MSDPPLLTVSTRNVLADITLMSWTPGQRWCFFGAVCLAVQSPEPGFLVDGGGGVLRVQDLARAIAVDWHMADRFLRSAVGAGKLAERDGLLYVPDLVGVSSSFRRRLVGVSSSPYDVDARGDLGQQTVLQPQQEFSVSAAVSRSLAEAAAADHSFSPSPVEADPSLPTSDLAFEESLSDERLRRIARGLRGHDERTFIVLRSLSQIMLPAAFSVALESLEARRQASDRGPLQSEARYYVATLKRMADEGQFLRRRREREAVA